MEGGGFYTGAITIEDVRAAKPEMIFFSGVTGWWTHDPDHLYASNAMIPRSARHPLDPGYRQPQAIPTGPRGEPLFQADNPEDFLRVAEKNAAHYGRHGILAFVAAHHLNTVVHTRDRRPTSFREWDDYNRLLDEAAARVLVDG